MRVIHLRRHQMADAPIVPTYFLIRGRAVATRGNLVRRLAENRSRACSGSFLARGCPSPAVTRRTLSGLGDGLRAIKRATLSTSPHPPVPVSVNRSRIRHVDL
jgi:hypothetical protein